MDDNIIIRLLNTYICDLNFTLRTYNVLRINELYTLRDIVKLKKTELKKIKNINGSSLNEIMHAVYLNGLCFMDDYPTFNRELLDIYKEIDEPYLKRIEELKFSLKILLALRKKNIYNIGDLISLQLNDLIKIQGLNKDDIKLIVSTIDNLGLNFGEEQGEKMSR